MPEYQPIKTRYGILRGREALTLERLVYHNNSLQLEAGLNLEYTSGEGQGRAEAFFEFSGVRVWSVTQLDDFRGNLGSSYDEVLGSMWLETAVQNSVKVRQYQVLCMFEILEVLCEKASLRLLELKN
ncbi:MAG: hypothetical protein ACK41E_08255 [Deinococcales bacterium]